MRGFGFWAITRPLRLRECFFVTFPSLQWALRSLVFALRSVKPVSFGTVHLPAAGVGLPPAGLPPVGSVPGGGVTSGRGGEPACGIATIVIERAGKVALKPVASTAWSGARWMPPATPVHF